MQLDTDQLLVKRYHACTHLVIAACPSYTIWGVFKQVVAEADGPELCWLAITSMPFKAHDWLDVTNSDLHVDVTCPGNWLQVGYKSMMYMVLHAEAVLDLVAVRDQEIQFRQVAGSFVQLQGKFLLHADQQARACTRH